MDYTFVDMDEGYKAKLLRTYRVDEQAYNNFGDYSNHTADGTEVFHCIVMYNGVPVGWASHYVANHIYAVIDFNELYGGDAIVTGGVSNKSVLYQEGLVRLAGLFKVIVRKKEHEVEISEDEDIPLFL